MKIFATIFVLLTISSTTFAYECSGTVSVGEKTEFIGKKISNPQSLADMTVFENDKIQIVAALDDANGLIRAHKKEAKAGKTVLVGFADSSATGMFIKTVQLNHAETASTPSIYVECKR